MVMTDKKIVVLNKEPVELCKILKFENLVMSGGEAKSVIAQGMVMVNNKVETRKRKKIYSGDTIEFQGIRLRALKTEI
jgi:ribosome-associated protein